MSIDVEVRDLTKRYGRTAALDGVTLAIEHGGLVGVLGPNGAGKTTLFEIVEGLREPTAGTVSVLGLDAWRRSRQLHERIGAQLQATAVPLELTPRETLRLFAAFFRRARPANDLLERVGLREKGDKRNGTLSGGERQRLAIALALVNDPELVILDEPTAGLDPVSRREIQNQIAELRALERTVLLSTHSVDEAERLCDRVIVLRGGRVVADGPPRELVARAGGAPSLIIVLGGETDPTPLLRAGAAEEGSDGAARRFVAPDARAAAAALAEVLRQPRAALLDLQMKRPSLEDVYLRLMSEESA